MFDFYKRAIAAQISDFSQTPDEKILDLLEIPKVADHGDFSIAIPKLRVKGNPVELAQTYQQKFQTNEYIIQTSSIGPFLNFKINKEHLKRSLLKEIFEKKEKYGSTDQGQGKKVVIEFSSPNIAKMFHAGHLRSTILGNFLKKIHEFNGWKTIALNYLGDWGKQFGLLAVAFEMYGDQQALEKDPIKHLYDVYVKINKDAEETPELHDKARNYFKRMEDGDEDALSLWKSFRELSIAKYKDIYGRLNVEFDVYSGESQVKPETINRVFELMDQKKLLQESQGAMIVDLSQYKLEKPIVRKSDGTSIYLTRDIGAAVQRQEEYQFDKMIYVVGSPQDLHMKQLFRILQLLDFPWAAHLVHVNFGMVKGMSTRKGNAVFLEDILNQTQENMHQVMKQNEKKYAQLDEPLRVSDQVGIAAVIVQDMAARRIRNYDFDWNRMFSFEGDTGPYLQYAYARLCSIERTLARSIEIDHVNFDLITEAVAMELIETLAKFPDTVLNAYRTHEPCSLVTYALRLSHAVSSCLENLWVVGAPEDVAHARLLLYTCARLTLGNALSLLGVQALDRM